MAGIAISSPPAGRPTKQSNYPQITSAAGLLSLLVETEWPLRIHALHKLNEVLDRFWPEIADFLSEIEKLYEHPTFPERGLAALVLSKVYYHLEEYDEALRYALGAGPLFDISEKSQYVQTITAKCIDEYVALRVKKYDTEMNVKLDGETDPMIVDEGADSQTVVIDERLEAIVERILEASKFEGDDKQALGIAFDARRLDKVEEIIMQSAKSVTILEYCMRNAQTLITTKRFRHEVLGLLSTIFYTLSPSVLEQEYPILCQCLFYQDDYSGVAVILSTLLKKGGDAVLMAYQIGFDLVDFEDQAFSRALLNHDLMQVPLESTAIPALLADSATGEDGESSSIVQEDNGSLSLDSETATETSNDIFKSALENLRYILGGNASIELRLQFLHRNNRADLVLLDNYRRGADSRNSITHHAVVIAHGLMQAGTTNDTFLRSHLDWLAKAVNWAKFSATASLGVINKGHIKESRSVLAKYLPASRSGDNPYSEGGAFYALGLIHANHSDQGIRSYLLNHLRMAHNNETLQHGCCLGLGLLCMGQNDNELYNEMRTVLLLDSAIAGEAAAYGIGLVMLGTASQKAIDELLAYAQDTQHEKIIRASAVAISMILFRKEEDAELVINRMAADKDALIRYGAMFTVGMAYCGTAQNSAIRRLLHVSVSDVSDDVRRAAVIALGFVLCNVPEQVPKILNLLSESYNAHVRYGAALAVGISSAGTAGVDAVNLLTSMTTDGTDFVRQGALIGLGLVMQQATEKMIEKVKKVREIIERVISDRHEDIMTRFGAVLAAGLIDAGGRNCRASFFSKNGNLRQEAAAGFCLFTQLWYWFPLIHGISLAFQPTALIGLTKDLKMPVEFSVKCVTKQSLFAYPNPTFYEKKETKKGILTAVLSASTKSKTQRAKSKRSFEASSTAPSGARASALSEELAFAGIEMSSDTSERPPTKGFDISSTAATVGGISSRLSHTGSTADSVDETTLTGSDDVNESVYTQADGGSAVSMESKVKKGEDRPIASTPSKEADERKQTATEERQNDTNKKNEPVEPSNFILYNPSRVLPQQEQHIEFIPNSRYVPVYPNRKSGFLVLRDTKPELPEKFVEPKLADGKEEKEAEPPEPFEWIG